MVPVSFTLGTLQEPGGATLTAGKKARKVLKSSSAQTRNRTTKIKCDVNNAIGQQIHMKITKLSHINIVSDNVVRHIHSFNKHNICARKEL